MGEYPDDCVCPAVRPMDAATTSLEKMAVEDDGSGGNELSMASVKDAADPDDAGSTVRPSVVTVARGKDAGEVRADEVDEVAGSVAVVDLDNFALERAATAEAAEEKAAAAAKP